MVPNSENGGAPEPTQDRAFWLRLIATGLESYVPEVDDGDGTEHTRLPALHDDWLSNREQTARDHQNALHQRTLAPFPPPVSRGRMVDDNGENNQTTTSVKPSGQGAPTSDLRAPEGDDAHPSAPEGAHESAEIVFDDAADSDHDNADPRADDEITADDIGATRHHDNDSVSHPGHFDEPNPDNFGRGKRVRKPKKSLFDPQLWTQVASFRRGGTYPKQKIVRERLNNQFLSTLKWDLALSAIKSADMRAMQRLLDAEVDPTAGCLEEMHPLALVANANSADTPNWDQAMNGPERDGYWEACKKKIIHAKGEGGCVGRSRAQGVDESNPQHMGLPLQAIPGWFSLQAQGTLLRAR
ncbi:hypothetical protein ACA910_000678 [Epithemia clementina (nom. ined.)]